MTGVLPRRGPAGRDEWTDGPCGLGQLSIIDLRLVGSQSTTDGYGREHVVFNREIYNFLELLHRTWIEAPNPFADRAAERQPIELVRA